MCLSYSYYIISCCSGFCWSKPAPASPASFGQDGFPQSVIFDNEHLKLLFEFMNSEVEVQQDPRVGLESQDGNLSVVSPLQFEDVQKVTKF